MRVWMGLSTILFGSLGGSLAGLSVYRWTHGAGCGGGTGHAGPLDSVGNGFSPCADPSRVPYVLTGVVLCIALSGLWHWRMTRAR